MRTGSSARALAVANRSIRTRRRLAARRIAASPSRCSRERVRREDALEWSRARPGLLLRHRSGRRRCVGSLLLALPPAVPSTRVSGGTRQKLNLALALLADPTILLLDEPYQGFDRGTYVNFWDHCRTWRETGMAVVVVTHMLAELDRVDRVIELPAHPSRIRARGAT